MQRCCQTLKKCCLERVIEKGQTAIIENKVDVLNDLLFYNPYTEVKAKLLNFSCENGNENFVKFFIECYEMNPHELLNSCDDAFTMACKGGHISIVKYIMAKFPSSWEKLSFFHGTTSININLGFLYALEMGHEELVDFLVPIAYHRSILPGSLYYLCGSNAPLDLVRKTIYRVVMEYHLHFEADHALGNCFMRFSSLTKTVPPFQEEMVDFLLRLGGTLSEKNLLHTLRFLDFDGLKFLIEKKNFCLPENAFSIVFSEPYSMSNTVDEVFVHQFSLYIFDHGVLPTRDDVIIIEEYFFWVLMDLVDHDETNTIESFASEGTKLRINFVRKMREKKRQRAAKKIYFWWIPICYDLERECGQRMRMKNFEAFQKLCIDSENVQ